MTEALMSAYEQSRGMWTVDYIMYRSAHYPPLLDRSSYPISTETWRKLLLCPSVVKLRGQCNKFWQKLPSVWVQVEGFIAYGVLECTRAVVLQADDPPW